MAITPKDISNWTIQLIEDDDVIYRPSKKANYTDNGVHNHTDFYLDKHKCLQHWWYTASWLQGKEEQLPPFEQTFAEYIESLSKEVSTVDLFGSLVIMEAISNLLKLKASKKELL